MAIEVDEQGLATAVIDDVTYHFTKWGAIDSTRALAKVLAIAKKFLAQSAAASASASSAEAKGRATAGVIEALLEGIGEDEERTLKVLQALCADRRMKADYKTIVFDEHYKGRPMHMLKVAQAHAEVQWGNFFGDALSLGGASEKSPTS